jgi:hypothetical protein
VNWDANSLELEVAFYGKPFGKIGSFSLDIHNESHHTEDHWVRRGRYLFWGRYSSGGLFVAFVMATVLLVPPDGKAKGREIGDLMDRLEVAYMEVVKAVMVSSVVDPDDLPYDQAGQWAEEITQRASSI